jgi:hypothetical protein
MVHNEEQFLRNSKLAPKVVGASPILGAVDVEISKQELTGCLARINVHPWDSITNIIARRESKDAPLLPEESFDHEYFPFLPAKPLNVTYEYPDLIAIFAPSLRSALVNAFNVHEIQTVYDMFKEYETHHALDGKEPEAVVHSLDCESCVFWVGILPDPQLMEFCHNALDSACFALNTDIHRDRRGNAMYNVEQFFRWMLNLRVKHREEWIRKAGLADVTARHLQEVFAEFDKTGEGLKTLQVFEMLGRLGRRPVTEQDQRRVVKYIEVSDVDHSGTIDFYEFLQLLRMDLNNFSMKRRRLEMKVISSTGLRPDQVNTLATLFDDADIDVSLSLSLKQVKLAFSDSAALGTKVILDKDKMDCFLEKVYEARDTITKMSNEKIPKRRITEEVTVSFAEFVLAMHLVCVNKSTDNTWTDLREVAQAMLSGTPELSNWIAARRPCENELQSRWELKMLTRHEDAYQVLISDG